jgi:branched-chain amino acid transport system ATP-binding protein
MARLEARDLAGGYPGMTVFSEVSFSLESGELLAILGANGAGKSALLETLQGLLKTGGGFILFDEQPVQDLPPEARAQRGMILLSDRRRLWPEMTVDEHLRVGAFRGQARRGWRHRALELRGLFTGLPKRRGARPTHLSSGQEQQLALARFGMSSPRVWLLDDPLAGLDEVMAGRVLNWIRAAAGGGAAVILTGQHIRELLSVATKAMFLEGGSLTPLPGGVGDPRVRRLL